MSTWTKWKREGTAWQRTEDTFADPLTDRMPPALCGNGVIRAWDIADEQGSPLRLWFVPVEGVEQPTEGWAEEKTRPPGLSFGDQGEFS
jgi:hypothetical protein